MPVRRVQGVRVGSVSERMCSYYDMRNGHFVLRDSERCASPWTETRSLMLGPTIGFRTQHHARTRAHNPHVVPHVPSELKRRNKIDGALQMHILTLEPRLEGSIC
eukprot:699417-Amphidinium_carterae.1